MKDFELNMIHPTALISEKANIGTNVTIGAFTIIYDYVNVGDNSIIGPSCVLGEPIANYYHRLSYQNPVLEIGEAALIRSGSVIYSGSTIGANLETGHRVIIREGSCIGLNMRIGINTEIQGGCYIGDYVRFHSSVLVSRGTRIGNYVWVFPYSVFTNDPHPPSEIESGIVVDDFAVICAHSTLIPGIRISTNSLIGAGSVVYHDVPEDYVISGNPARKIGSIDQIKNRATGESVYPWREHFDRGMPWQGIGFYEWDQLRRRKEI